MRIIKANRELLEEEYDPMPLLTSVFEENVKKYKSVEDLSPQYLTDIFQHFMDINKVPERRNRVKQFMDIAEYMIDADTLWGLIEDTANSYSVKKLKEDLNDLNSGMAKWNNICV